MSDREKKEIERLREALQKIVEWKLPESGQYWPDGKPMSYGSAFGSNGERDYMRALAERALNN